MSGDTFWLGGAFQRKGRPPTLVTPLGSRPYLKKAFPRPKHPQPTLNVGTGGGQGLTTSECLTALRDARSRYESPQRSRNIKRTGPRPLIQFRHNLVRASSLVTSAKPSLTFLTTAPCNDLGPYVIPLPRRDLAKGGGGGFACPEEEGFIRTEDGGVVSTFRGR